MTSPGPKAAEHFASSVFDTLLDRLSSGSLPAGSRINITVVARELGVSPTPVREALSRLEASGLVVRTTGRGFATAPLFTRQAMTELMEARAQLEGGLTELAAAGRKRSQLTAALKDALDLQRAATDAASRRRTSEAFHLVLARAAGNRFLLDAYLSFGGHIERFRLQAAAGSFDHDAALREHQSIIAAIDQGDPAAASWAMRSHLAASNTRSQDVIDDAVVGTVGA